MGQEPLQSSNVMIHMSIGNNTRRNRDDQVSPTQWKSIRAGVKRELDWLHPHEIAARLSPGRWRKDGPNSAYAVCPCHTDGHPSLHITVKEDALLVHCFPCGKDRQAGIVAALAERGIAVFPPTDRAVSKPKIAGAKTRVATYLSQRGRPAALSQAPLRVAQKWPPGWQEQNVLLGSGAKLVRVPGRPA